MYVCVDERQVLLHHRQRLALAQLGLAQKLKQHLPVVARAGAREVTRPAMQAPHRA
jgi:hypothetical protein